MEKKNGISIITIIIVVLVVVIIATTTFLLVNIGNNKNKNNIEENNVEDNSSSSESNVDQNNNDIEIQYNADKEKIEDKINEIRSKQYSNNIPNDLILTIDGQEVVYSYNWSYNGFKELYNAEGIFKESDNDYDLTYDNGIVNYDVDFKLFPTVKNSVSNVSLGVSCIELSTSSRKQTADEKFVITDWGISKLYLGDNIDKAIQQFGLPDNMSINDNSYYNKNIGIKKISGMICRWNNVWLGNKLANICMIFDNDFKLTSLKVDTVIYDTAEIETFKSRSTHVSK